MRFPSFKMTPSTVTKYSTDLKYIEGVKFFNCSDRFYVGFKAPHRYIDKMLGRPLDDEIFEDEGLWVPSTCTVDGFTIVDRNVRRSSKCVVRFTFIIDVVTNFCKINSLHIVGDVELIRYVKDDFTSRHMDKQGDFTCLYFYRGQEFTGGDLVLYDWYEPGGKIIFNASSLTKGTLVIFPTNMLHEVLPVTSGVRYCFKMSLKKNENSNEANHYMLD